MRTEFANAPKRQVSGRTQAARSDCYTNMTTWHPFLARTVTNTHQVHPLLSHSCFCRNDTATMRRMSSHVSRHLTPQNKG